MDTFENSSPGDPGTGTPAPTSKLGLIGLILGILGFIVYCLPLAAAFVMGATGNAPAATDPLMIGIGLISNCGAIIGVIGGVLGAVSLARGENKTYGIIALVLGVLLLCTCVGLSFTGLLISG
jgi:hypothetical protein